MPKRLRSLLVLLAALCASVLATVAFPLDAAPPTPLTARPRASEPRWLARHEAIKAQARRGKAEVVFLGDSITQGWEGTPTWRRRYVAPYAALNAGISADRVEHVLWRVRDGALDGLSPKAIVLLAGVNNLAVEHPERIAATHLALVDELTARFPRAQIIVLGVFPSGAEPTHQRRGRIRRLNAELARLGALPRVTYVDIGARFLAADGRIARPVMYDHLHLTRHGYEIWSAALAAPLAKALRAGASLQARQKRP